MFATPFDVLSRSRTLPRPDRSLIARQPDTIPADVLLSADARRGRRSGRPSPRRFRLRYRPPVPLTSCELAGCRFDPTAQSDVTFRRSSVLDRDDLIGLSGHRGSSRLRPLSALDLRQAHVVSKICAPVSRNHESFRELQPAYARTAGRNVHGRGKDWGTGLMAGQLFGVQPWDPLMLILAILLLGLAALVASVVPA